MHLTHPKYYENDFHFNHSTANYNRNLLLFFFSLTNFLQVTAHSDPEIIFPKKGCQTRRNGSNIEVMWDNQANLKLRKIKYFFILILSRYCIMLLIAHTIISFQLHFNSLHVHSYSLYIITYFSIVHLFLGDFLQDIWTLFSVYGY